MYLKHFRRVRNAVRVRRVKTCRKALHVNILLHEFVSSVFLLEIANNPSRGDCVCIIPPFCGNICCDSWGDPHVTGILDKRTVTCGCPGNRTYLDNPYLNIWGTNTRVNENTDVTFMTEVRPAKHNPVLCWTDV